MGCCSLLTGPNRFDQWAGGEKPEALSETEVAGFAVFIRKGQCATCHADSGSPALFTDHGFHNTGYAAHFGSADPGRFQVTSDPADRSAFKTPGLRNVALTGPYMHDGKLATLYEVIEYYNDVGELNLTGGEKENLEAFLRALTSKKRPRASDVLLRLCPGASALKTLFPVR